MLRYVDDSQPWAPLLETAVHLIENAERQLGQPLRWSIGGGTVLMFEFGHRLSKDIDVFFEDVQVLGFFNPRLQDSLSQFADGYDESAGAIKLRASEGDIDFVVSTALTENPYVTAQLLGNAVTLQTAPEIVARKVWHRGDRATARDLMDLAAVAIAYPQLPRLIQASLLRNGLEFLRQCDARRVALEPEFQSIYTLNFNLDYDGCVAIVQDMFRIATELDS